MLEKNTEINKFRSSGKTMCSFRRFTYVDCWSACDMYTYLSVEIIALNSAFCLCRYDLDACEVFDLVLRPWIDRFRTVRSDACPAASSDYSECVMMG